MGVVQRNTKAHIRFSTQIIKRLGEELNPSIDQSILELVKNSYDADARNCIVDLKDITDIGGTITITDDGKGMDANEIIDGWLVLGESTKSNTKRTQLGRVPAGSKGLGRLAALRMGHNSRLESIPKKRKAFRYNLEIDWDKFDKAKLVEDVELSVNRERILTNDLYGTTIAISNLKQRIGVRDIKKIARGLILLADPFDDDPNSFKPILKADEFKEMERLVAGRYFDEAEYHLVASVNDKGLATASVFDYRGNPLFATSHKNLAVGRKGAKYECPPTTFDLWAFLLSETYFSARSSAITLSEVQEWLGEVGGVHLYENGLRVSPYGNPGNDWLDLNLARSKSPEERPSTNNSIGIVRVKDSKGLLSQKTDRSGFIENDTFHEIKAFCQDALQWMAKRRLEIAEQKRRAERQRTASESDNTREGVEEVINLVAPTKRALLQRAFTKYDNARKAEVKALRAEIQLYRTLSTAGITAAIFSHESRGNSLKVLTQAIKSIERRLKENLSKNFDAFFAKPLSIIYQSLDSFKVLGSATLKLIEHEKRRPVRVELNNIIEHVLETFKPFFKGRKITIDIRLPEGNPYLRSTEAAIESIVTNLLNNSIVALEDSTDERVIRLTALVQEKIYILKVADNGPGIKNISTREIWLPGHTTNPKGTGLGLTIVRDATYDLGGKVRALATGELGGAEIIIELPIIGV